MDRLGSTSSSTTSSRSSALGLDRPLLAGSSEGGATATLVALRRPELVRAVVNHAGFDYFDAARMAQQLERGFRPLFGGHPGATSADPDSAERAFLAVPPTAATFTTMQSDYDSAPGEGRWRAYLGEFFDRTPAGVGSTTGDFAGLATPTLLVAGDRDLFCPVEVACAAYRALPAGVLGIAPDTGHDITTPIIDLMVRSRRPTPDAPGVLEATATPAGGSPLWPGG